VGYIWVTGVLLADPKNENANTQKKRIVEMRNEEIRSLGQLL
jgi:hypothetical protein